MTCPNCYKSNNIKDEVCKYCGAELNVDAPLDSATISEEDMLHTKKMQSSIAIQSGIIRIVLVILFSQFFILAFINPPKDVMTIVVMVFLAIILIWVLISGISGIVYGTRVKKVIKCYKNGDSEALVLLKNKTKKIGITSQIKDWLNENSGLIVWLGMVMIFTVIEIRQLMIGKNSIIGFMIFMLLFWGASIFIVIATYRSKH